MKRVLACILTAVLILAFLPGNVDAKYQYIDYTKIYGSNTSKAYDVECSLGPAVVTGKLSYTSSFAQEEIDAEIRDVLQWMKITEEDIGKAHAAVAKWDAQKDFTEQDARNIINNWAKMFGIETPVKMAEDLYDFVRSDENGWNELGLDMTDRLTEIVQDRVETFVFQSLRTQFYYYAKEGGLLNLAGKLLNAQNDLQYRTFSFGSGTLSGKHVLELLKNTLVVSAEQYLKDKQRWADRVDAVNATALLKTFYDTVNNYLLAKHPKNGNWILTAAGGGTREFTFFGAEGNKQHYSVGLSASKISSSFNAYGYRGDGISTPFGIYLGSAAIRLTHNLGSFNYQFWNLPIGQLPCEGWLDDMTTTLALAGGAEIDVSGGATIIRKLTAPELEFTLSGGYSYQYNSTIPANPGNRDITATINLNQFEDSLYTHSDHKLTLKQGIQNVQGDQVTALEYVTMSLHSEMDGNNLQVICDDIDAYVNIGGIEFADIQTGDITAANTWDYNIWADMDSGLKITVRTN